MSQPKTQTVIFIEKRRFICDLLVSFFEKCAPDISLRLFESVQNAERSLEREVQANLLVWSLGQADSGVLKSIQNLKARHVDLPIAIISDSEDPNFILALCKAGVSGYLPMSTKLEAAVHALRSVAAGASIVPVTALSASEVSLRPLQRVEERLPTPRSPEERMRFTVRQREVLAGLQQGKSNKIIAADLRVKESTVKVHVASLMKKLNARNRTQVVTFSQDLNLPARQFSESLDREITKSGQ